MRQQRFRFPRPKTEPQAPAWLITYDPRNAICGYAIRRLLDWRPCGSVCYAPTLERARALLPAGAMVQLEELESARLLAKSGYSGNLGRVLEIWF